MSLPRHRNLEKIEEKPLEERMPSSYSSSVPISSKKGTSNYSSTPGFATSGENSRKTSDNLSLRGRVRGEFGKLKVSTFEEQNSPALGGKKNGEDEATLAQKYKTSFDEAENVHNYNQYQPNVVVNEVSDRSRKSDESKVSDKSGSSFKYLPVPGEGKSTPTISSESTVRPSLTMP